MRGWRVNKTAALLGGLAVLLFGIACWLQSNPTMKAIDLPPAAHGGTTNSLFAIVSEKKRDPAATRRGDGVRPRVAEAAVAQPVPETGARENLRVIQQYERCSRLPHDDSQVVDEAARRLIVADKIREYYGKPPLDNPGQAGVEIATRLQQEEKEVCAQVSKDDMASWRASLEGLALSGNRDAQLAYAGSVWRDSGTQALIDADPEGFNRRLEQVREFLWADFSNGNCDNLALNVMWRIRQLGPATNYVGWSILGNQGLAVIDRNGPQDRTDKERADIQAEFARIRAAVPAAELADADRTVAYLQQFNCAGN